MRNINFKNIAIETRFVCYGIHLAGLRALLAVASHKLVQNLSRSTLDCRVILYYTMKK